MTERGSDIEFDFFEEPETQEGSTRARPERRGPRRPVRPPSGLTPLLRFAGLVAFVIFVVVVLALWVQGCRSASKRDTYSDYMGEMRTIAGTSEDIGGDLNRLLTTPGIKAAQLQTQLGGLAGRQGQGVDQARAIDVPGRLREEHRNAIESLEFRVSGLSRLQDAFAQTSSARNAREAGTTLAEQAQRLLTSDIVWDDLFREPAVAELREQDVRGVDVPDSNFLTNPDLATQRLMTSIYQRIRGAQTPSGTPSGRHGTGLVSVKALPGGKTLNVDDDENTVIATSDLAFEVTLENQGDSQEVQVQVVLRVQQNPRPIIRRATIDLINPGERKTVTFRQLGQIVQFVQKTPVRVEIRPVKGEQFLGNNVATYSVIFSLPPP
jgi:hypothetical protein